MMNTADRLTGLCGVVGALIGLAAGFVVAALNLDIGVNAPWVFAGAAAVAGAAGTAGYESAQRGHLHRWGAATLTLSLVCGGLVALTEQAGIGAQVPAGMPLAVLGFGVLGWALLAGRTTTLAQAARPLRHGAVEVPLGAVSGGVFGLGYGLLYALTYTPPCQPFAYCLPYGAWQGFIAMLPATTIGGLAFGMTLSVALGLSSRVRPAEPERG